jgi:hypothetical protein
VFTGQYADSRGKTATTTGKLMANEALYPGAPDYKTAGSSALPIGSGTPNIRSALFTLPIIRETGAEKGLPAGDRHIPWVTRFNNFGNTALDTDGNSSNGYQFVQNAATPSNGQLLSRGDFQAQILHYRLRGVDSVNLFQASQGSVVGYSRAQEQADIQTGFGQSSVVNNIFSRNKFALANLNTVIGVTGGNSADTSAAQSFVKAGAAFSGVYDSAATSGTSRRLAILLSNLGTGSKNIDLPNLIGGFHTFSGNATIDDDYVVAAGQHRLLTFTLTKNSLTKNQTAWLLDASSFVFLDNNRNGIGIPEPTSAGLLGLGAVGLLARRRRKA